MPFLDAKRQKTGSPATFLSFKLNRFFFDRSRVWRWSDVLILQSVVYPGHEGFHFCKGSSGHVLLRDRLYVHRTVVLQQKNRFRSFNQYPILLTDDDTCIEESTC